MSDSAQQSTEAGVVADLARRSIAPLTIKEDGQPTIIVFQDKKIKSLESLNDKPRRKRATVALIDTGSFIEYLNTHKVAGQTTVFGLATEQGGSFNAILDYHGGAEVSNAGAPNWGDHTATLTLATTPEGRRWTAKSGELMSQEAFAEFIEDNLNDIIRPDAAAILDIAQLLVAKKTVNFKSGKRLANGETKLEYVETIESTGGKTNDTLAIPESFVLGIVPFVGADGVEITARLRYRISDSGKLSFAFILNRPFKVIENAFLLARQAIEEKTGLTVHIGSGKVTPPPSL